MTEPAKPAIDLDHVALATRDVGAALDTLVGQLGGLLIFGGNNLGFRALQVRLGPDATTGLNVEVLEPWDHGSNDFLHRFLERHGPSPHHLTFKVDDLARKLDEVEAAGVRIVNVDLSSPNWKEAFVHPKDGHGTVIQFAEQHGFPAREDLLAEVRRSGAHAHPQWWPDPPPRAERDPVLRRVVLRTPELPAAAGFYTGVLGGREVAAGEGWVEFGWPGGGRVALEQRPGDAAVDRIEIEVSGPGVTGELTVAGTRLVVGPG